MRSLAQENIMTYHKEGSSRGRHHNKGFSSVKEDTITRVFLKEGIMKRVLVDEDNITRDRLEEKTMIRALLEEDSNTSVLLEEDTMTRARVEFFSCGLRTWIFQNVGLSCHILKFATKKGSF